MAERGGVTGVFACPASTNAIRLTRRRKVMTGISAKAAGEPSQGPLWTQLVSHRGTMFRKRLVSQERPKCSLPQGRGPYKPRRLSSRGSRFWRDFGGRPGNPTNSRGVLRYPSAKHFLPNGRKQVMAGLSRKKSRGWERGESSRRELPQPP